MWVARDDVTMCVFVGRGSDQRSMTLHVYLWEWLQVVRSCAGVNDTEIDYAGGGGVTSDGQINASAKLSEHRTACFRTGGFTSFSDASDCFCLTLPTGNV